jgi:hypothetical protein
MQFAWAVEKSRFSFSAMALRFLCLPSIYQKEVKTQALIAAGKPERRDAELAQKYRNSCMAVAAYRKRNCFTIETGVPN